MQVPGVLLVNLGSPRSPGIQDVRRYLSEFLMDARVLDLPPLLRWLVVHAFILPFRPRRSAHAYRTIWWQTGSPLLVISQQVAKLLGERLPFPVSLGMRYGEPSIKSAIYQLTRQDVDRITLLPLYPHYAMSTFETVVEEVNKVRRSSGVRFDLQVLPPFFEAPMYINALVESALPSLEQGFDHLLFSYHGVPKRHLQKTDPTRSHCLIAQDCCSVSNPAHAVCYRHQALRTTAAFIQAAHVAPQKTTIAFQSRLGMDAWLEPSTEAEIRRLAEAGVRRLLVICPSFVSDCLETLEEIGIRGRDVFFKAGGHEFISVPCLNTHPAWIRALDTWLRSP